jgi:hypothetical protein
MVLPFAAAVMCALGCDGSAGALPRTAQNPTPAPYQYAYPPPAYIAPQAGALAYGPPPVYAPAPTNRGVTGTGVAQGPPSLVYAAPPQVAPVVPAGPPSPVRPLLGALFGPAAWQAEARAVARELVAHLAPTNAARVATIPLVFDQNPNEVNAFAGCDDNGAPFVAGTEGLLEAIDGIAETKATDELFGTQAYDAYVSVVAPRLVSKDGGSAMLPVGVIPAQVWLDPRRASRAHEIFDEMAAFTFGHELSHHYLGHTGCATGAAGGAGPAISQLSQLATAVLPGLNQPNEVAADTNGCINTLDTGLARGATAYRWTEEGGLWLLDFFSRLERASGANPWLGFLQTHPNPGLRIPIVEGVAATWRFQHR